MSPTPPEIPPDDRLARAEEALRGLPMPAGPSDESLARALAVARAAEGRAGVIPWTMRRVVMSTLKVAAAVVVAGGLFYAARPPAASATAFEAVAQKLHDARTISYKITTAMEGAPPGAGPMKMTLYFRAPKSARMESEAPGGAPVTVLDGERHRMVMLDPAKKSALILEDVNPPEDFAAKSVENLRNLPGKEARPAGREQIGGVEAEGFRIEQGEGMTMTAWVDPKTRLPLRIDVALRVNDKDIRSAMTDFRLDPPLDDALFRIDPPEGYAVQRMAGSVLFDRPEANAVRVLRAYAEKNGGAFPNRLDNPLAFASLFPKPKPGETPSFTQLDPKTMELVFSLGRVMGLKSEVKGFVYRPAGVKLGDADKPLLWFKPERSEKYRVIYGDLHIGDATADALPEAPKP